VVSLPAASVVGEPAASVVGDPAVVVAPAAVVVAAALVLDPLLSLSLPHAAATRPSATSTGNTPRRRDLANFMFPPWNGVTGSATVRLRSEPLHIISTKSIIQMLDTGRRIGQLPK
jgi:hypothetical protein